MMLYLGLDGCDSDIPHHTVYLSKDYVNNLADIETSRVVLRRWWDDHWYLDFIGLAVAIIMAWYATSENSF